MAFNIRLSDGAIEIALRLPIALQGILHDQLNLLADDPHRLRRPALRPLRPGPMYQFVAEGHRFTVLFRFTYAPGDAEESIFVEEMVVERGTNQT